jgi:hypothetical protein
MGMLSFGSRNLEIWLWDEDPERPGSVGGHAAFHAASVVMEMYHTA